MADALEAANPNGILGSRATDKAVTMEPYTEGDVWVHHRGCVAKGKKTLKWMGQFKTCSSDWKDEKQRGSVHKAVMRFQTARFARTESYMRDITCEGAACWQRRRLSIKRNGKDYIPSTVSTDQVMLAFDASLRKTYADVRRDMCLENEPKNGKYEDMNKRYIEQAKKDFWGIWAKHMRNDHGFDIREGMYSDKYHGSQGRESLKDENVFRLLEMKHLGTVFIYIPTGDGDSSRCDGHGTWLTNIKVNCQNGQVDGSAFAETWASFGAGLGIEWVGKGCPKDLTDWQDSRRRQSKDNS